MKLLLDYGLNLKENFTVENLITLYKDIEATTDVKVVDLHGINRYSI